MSGASFDLVPRRVPRVATKHRNIVTKIPVPQSIGLFNKLERYESRSMHGQLPVVWDRAEDFKVYDKWGNNWIDFTSTIFVANSGHSNPEVLRALDSQIQKPLIHTYTFANEARVKFLEKLIRITPSFCQKAFLLSAGTEATECAMKLMRMHGMKISENRVGIVSFRGGMHGRTMGAEMLKGNHLSSAWIGYLDPHIHHLTFPYPWLSKNNNHDWAEHFNREMDNLQRQGVVFENICGFMIESYLGWGAIFYPKPYIKALVKFARRYGIVVTFDEIQSGIGRTGKLFAYQHYGVDPDLICLGKALSGGLPLSAVVGRRKIMDIPEVGSMSSTHSANPLCCAAALANLETIINERIIRKSAHKGIILHKRLNEIKRKFLHRIAYVCGEGLVAGMMFKNPRNGKPDTAFATKVCERAMQKGLLLVYTGRESIKIGPPLTISDAALLEGISVFEDSIKEIDKKA